MGEKLVQTDTAGIKISPPLLYFGFAFLGIGVDFLFPAPIGLPSYAIYVGIALALLSLGFIGYIARFFRKAGTSSNPGKQQTTLSTPDLINIQGTRSILLPAQYLSGSV